MVLADCLPEEHYSTRIGVRGVTPSDNALTCVNFPRPARRHPLQAFGHKAFRADVPFALVAVDAAAVLAFNLAELAAAAGPAEAAEAGVLALLQTGLANVLNAPLVGGQSLHRRVVLLVRDLLELADLVIYYNF